MSIKNKISALLLIFISSFNLSAQVSPENLDSFRAYEDTLMELGKMSIWGEDIDERLAGAYHMIPTLVAALKMENSFHYPFERAETISIQYPEGDEFRIFTWRVQLNNGTYRHFGAIQMNTPQLKLFPLFDAAQYYSNLDTITDNNHWYGAMYYNIISHKHNDKDYYLLFGLNNKDPFSTQKLVEVLTFEDGKPVFGSPVFGHRPKLSPANRNRFIIEYDSRASVSLNYFDEYGKIIFDHIRPENSLSEGVYSTYIPDGSYEGFKFDPKTGKWLYIEELFQDGSNAVQIPAPIDFERRRSEGKSGIPQIQERQERNNNRR